MTEEQVPINASPALPDISDAFLKDVSKEYIRKQVWDFMSKNKLTLFPGAYERIPNFKSVDLASRKLAELKSFQYAKTVEINPDKPLEYARVITLENNKELYVPIPRLKHGLFKKLVLDSDNKKSIHKIVSRTGIESVDETVGIDDRIHIDLLVVGSVAVSKDGYRIGKGRGFADLEFALLREMNALDEHTVIVTIVHDCQVFDKLPESLFKKYDVPVDYILTPTRVIEVKTKLPRPAGIFWDVLTQKRLDSMDVLSDLKKKHESEGRVITLASAEEHPAPRRYFFNRHYLKRRQQLKAARKQLPQNADKSENQSDETKKIETAKPRNSSRKSLSNRHSSKIKKDDALKENSDKKKPVDESNENSENIPPKLKHKKKFKKPRIDYSLHVSNIRKGVKVKDLKMALKEKGIRPNNITWRGYRGFCFLHYAKNKKKITKDADKKGDESLDESFAIDNIIEVIQQLKINPDDVNLNVKVVEPITKIETMNITAV